MGDATFQDAFALADAKAALIRLHPSNNGVKLRWWNAGQDMLLADNASKDLWDATIDYWRSVDFIPTDDERDMFKLNLHCADAVPTVRHTPHFICQCIQAGFYSLPSSGSNREDIGSGQIDPGIGPANNTLATTTTPSSNNHPGNCRAVLQLVLIMTHAITFARPRCLPTSQPRRHPQLRRHLQPRRLLQLSHSLDRAQRLRQSCWCALMSCWFSPEVLRLTDGSLQTPNSAPESDAAAVDLCSEQYDMAESVRRTLRRRFPSAKLGVHVKQLLPTSTSM